MPQDPTAGAPQQIQVREQLVVRYPQTTRADLEDTDCIGIEPVIALLRDLLVAWFPGARPGGRAIQGLACACIQNRRPERLITLAVSGGDLVHLFQGTVDDGLTVGLGVLTDKEPQGWRWLTLPSIL